MNLDFVRKIVVCKILQIITKQNKRFEKEQVWKNVTSKNLMTLESINVENDLTRVFRHFGSNNAIKG